MSQNQAKQPELTPEAIDIAMNRGRAMRSQAFKAGVGDVIRGVVRLSMKLDEKMRRLGAPKGAAAAN